ncbi:ABC transporter ATP-binding protein [Candidatus Nomurabacteria bacterium]|nr:ABC transporter ATP-binding protein [Candidatus Nomurabacteria bacterium]
MERSNLGLYYRGVKAILLEQFRTNRVLVSCLIAGKILQGLNPIGEAYILAKIIGQFASLIGGQAGKLAVISWLVIWLVYRLLTNLLFQGLYLAQVKLDNQIEIVVQRVLVRSMYQIDIARLEGPDVQPLLVRINQNSQLIAGLIYSLLSIFTGLVTYLATFIALLSFSPVVGLAAGLIVIPLAWIDLRAVALRRKNFDNVYQDYRVKDSLAYFLTMPSKVIDIKILGGVRQLLDIYQKHIRRISYYSESVAKKEIAGELAGEGSGLIVQFLTDLWLVFKAASGGMTLSQIVLARGLISNLVSSTGSMASSIKNATESLSYVVDIERLRELAAHDNPDAKLKIGGGQDLKLEFCQVDFHYPNQSELAERFSLKDISFGLEAGQKLALVGENGSGKTSIIKLLLGFYTPNSGEIRIDGQELGDYDQDQYLANFAVMAQDDLIFNALSIRQNILLGNPDSIKDDQIWQALEAVRLDKFVKSLPKGLNTQLWTNLKDGVNLSGGQEQRLGLARTLLRSSRVLVLDEPTSAIDAKAEEEIVDQIFTDPRYQSILIVSHRLSTARRADKILFIAQGKIIEQGSHQELMDQKGAYFEMFEKQAKGYR